MTRWGLPLLLCLGWCGAALAQSGWTVQTVALRDLRDAEAEVARLRALGFAAYTEFTMSDGLQYVRVRAGCSDTREVAEAWADLLRNGVTRDAVAVPIESPLPGHVPCVSAEIGFRKPGAWALVSSAGELPTFRVEVAEHLAFLRHDGVSWRLWQSVAPEPELALPAPVLFLARSGSVAGRPVVRSDAAGLLCPGQLLAVAGEVAIVDWGDAVVACRVLAGPP